jgi:hypothetical protein
LAPAAVVFFLAAVNYFTDTSLIKPFQLVSKEQFLGAMAGFLTYRVALFVTEVGTEMRFDDVLGILPGSFAEAYRQTKEAKRGKTATASDANIAEVGRALVFSLCSGSFA